MKHRLEPRGGAKNTQAEYLTRHLEERGALPKAVSSKDNVNEYLKDYDAVVDPNTFLFDCVCCGKEFDIKELDKNRMCKLCYEDDECEF